MGCCISRPAGGPNAPHPGNAATSEMAGIVDVNEAAPRRARASNEDESPNSPNPASRRTARNRQSQHHQPALAQHINKPLRRHEWTSKNRTWTRAAIDRERTEFFETRVTGRPEVWQTLHAALAMMWVTNQKWSEVEAGDGDRKQAASDADTRGEHDASVALATAQTMLSAADVTLPTGDLAQGAYDALGNYYALPEHVVADPTNMVGRTIHAPHDAVPVGEHDTEADLAPGDDGEETAAEGEDDESTDEPTLSRTDEKGKAVVHEEKIKVRARLSEGAQDVTITAGRGETVRSIAKRVAEHAQLPSERKIRIAYMGKMLKEASPLPTQGWKTGHVVNALVFGR